MPQQLLTRDQFREMVFARDRHKCVICGAPGQDAHHIVERRLFSDGGYYIDNGATLCGPDHLRAEETSLSCEEIRDRAGILEVVLPPHLYGDQRYDKWGNPILENGTRLRGELFEDESVRKVIRPVLHLFTTRVKYPRTWHVPWSKGATSDDRILETTDHWTDTEVVVTEKMDGENTTMYRDYLHARSLEYNPHPSRDRIKALHATIGHEIPEGWRLCGENLTAVHSIRYDDLPDFFLVFSLWNERNACLSWDATCEWADLLGLKTVPLLYRGPFRREALEEMARTMDLTKREGYVIRPAGEFHYREFRARAGKFVRESHVQTHGGWMRAKLEFNHW
jgi:hypothetical protein